MKELDADAFFTPKGHCELAGRGIEHLWGVAKMTFRKENATLGNDKRVNKLKQRVKTNHYVHSYRNLPTLFKTGKRMQTLVRCYSSE